MDRCAVSLSLTASDGVYIAPTRSSVLTSGANAATSSGEIKCASIPYRSDRGRSSLNSSHRASFDAKRKLPTRCKPVSCSVNFGMVSYVLADSVYMRVYLGAWCVPRVTCGVWWVVSGVWRMEGKVAVFFKGLEKH